MPRTRRAHALNRQTSVKSPAQRPTVHAQLDVPPAPTRSGCRSTSCGPCRWRSPVAGQRKPCSTLKTGRVLLSWPLNPNCKPGQRNPERSRNLTPDEVEELLACKEQAATLDVWLEHFVSHIERRRELLEKVRAIAASDFLPLLEQLVDDLREKSVAGSDLIVRNRQIRPAGQQRCEMSADSAGRPSTRCHLVKRTHRSCRPSRSRAICRSLQTVIANSSSGARLPSWMPRTWHLAGSCIAQSQSEQKQVASRSS